MIIEYHWKNAATSISGRNWLAGLVLLAATGIGKATPSAVLTGRITDVSGSTGADASVCVAMIGTGPVRNTKSGGEGMYLISELPPGEYAL